jgi:hypothetical protein
MNPIFNLLPGILKAVGKVLGIGKLDEAASALENAQIPPEKQVELQQALLEQTKALRELDVEELKTFMSEAIAEIQSPSKYVSWARPTGLYCFYVGSLALIVAMIFGVKIELAPIIGVLSPMAGVGGVYTYRRTTEKMNGNGTSE